MSRREKVWLVRWKVEGDREWQYLNRVCTNEAEASRRANPGRGEFCDGVRVEVVRANIWRIDDRLQRLKAKGAAHGSR
jgi:hypothetical protein